MSSADILKSAERAPKKSDRLYSQGTRQMDQRAIDNKIRAWKKGKSDTEKKLFDMLMLGSLGRGNTKRLLDLTA